MNSKIPIFIVAIFSLIYCIPVNAFDDGDTHPRLTQAAVRNPALKNSLITFTGYTSGFRKNYWGLDHKNNIKNSSVLEWLRQGSTDEDAINLCRAATHFHRPVKSDAYGTMTNSDWATAGGDDSIMQAFSCGAGGFRSALTWATGFTAPTVYTPVRSTNYSILGTLGFWGVLTYNVEQNMGWDHARNYLYQALTATTQSVREETFAKTFLSVGMVMHLLQDMAVPAHVRNDFSSHLINSTSWFSNPFENYVADEDNRTVIDAAVNATPAGPSLGASTHVTDFWDSNYYTGNNPNDVGTHWGLSEYTNANFLSDNTRFTPAGLPYYHFTYPSKSPSQVQIIKDPRDPSKTVERMYFIKTANEGETRGGVGYKLAGDDYLHLKVPPSTPFEDEQTIMIPPMDDYVHADYAQLLLPRAVGYSAVLLDYFFRGTIELTFPNPANERFSTIHLMARNNTATGEEMTSPEEIKLVVRYKLMKEDPSQGKIVREEIPQGGGDGYHYIVVPVKRINSQIPDISRSTPVDLEFDLSASPLPIWAYDITLQVVFKGKLGNEAGAVAVGTTRLADVGGDIDLTLPNKGIYGITASTGSFSEFRVKAANVSASGATMSDGTVELIVWYKRADQDPYQNQPTDKSPLDPEYYYVRVPEKNSARSIPRGSTRELVFDLAQKPLPLWATDVRVYVVYTGQVGTNENVVAVGFKDIAEPTPIDIVNNMDHVCVNGNFLVAGSLDATNAVGKDSFGRINSDIYPHRLKDVYLAFTADSASASNYSARMSAIDPGQYGRVFIMTDYSFKVSSSVTVEDLYGPLYDRWELTFGNSVTTEDGVLNQVVNENGVVNDYYPGMATERGLKTWWGIHYENPEWPAGSQCDSSVATPSLIGPVTVDLAP